MTVALKEFIKLGLPCFQNTSVKLTYRHLKVLCRLHVECR